MATIWTPGLCETKLNRNDAGRGRMQAERDRQLAALAVRSPMLAPAAQRDAGHLSLFAAANEPVLL